MSAKRDLNDILATRLSDVPPLRPTLLDDVFDQTRTIPQRRQRWPLHLLEDGRTRLAGMSTRDAVPIAFPAASGRQPARGFRVFSALRFVVAAVIVALFGGFLLAGVLTTPQGDEIVPAAATDPASPTTTTHLLSGMVTEEVEPGVYRVVNDGVRDIEADLAIQREGENWLEPTGNHQVVAGLDGSVWVIDGDAFYRLGVDGVHVWPDSVEPPPGQDVDFAVAPDGTVWLDDVGWTRESTDRCLGGFYSFDGESWTPSHEVDDPARPDCWRHDLALGKDGSVIISRDVLGEGMAIERRTAEGWERLGEPLDGLRPSAGLFVTDDGEVWFERRFGNNGLVRLVDGAWQTFEPLDDPPIGSLAHPGDGDILVGPDGEVWLLGEQDIDDVDEVQAVLARHDRTDWQQWLVPSDFRVLPPAQMESASDGVLWLAWPSIGWWGFSAPADGPGLVRWDGSTWQRFLPGSVIVSMDIAPDNSVWALATPSGEPADFLRGHLYVITPEAVLAAE